MPGKSSQVAGDEATPGVSHSGWQTNLTMTERHSIIAFLEPAFYLTKFTLSVPCPDSSNLLDAG